MPLNWKETLMCQSINHKTTSFSTNKSHSETIITSEEPMSQGVTKLPCINFFLAYVFKKRQVNFLNLQNNSHTLLRICISFDTDCRSDMWTWNRTQKSRVHAEEWATSKGHVKCQDGTVRAMEVYMKSGMHTRASGVKCGVEWVKRNTLRWSGQFKRMKN